MNVIDDGYKVFENVLPSQLYTELNDFSKFYIERTLIRQQKSGNIGYNLFRTEALEVDFPFQNLIHQEPIYSYLKSALGEDFILNEILIHFSLPQNNMQELHADVNQLFIDEKTVTPPFSIGVHYPMVDFNAKTGGTRIIPHTHNLFEEPTRLENEDLSKVAEYTPTVTEKSCLVRDCRAWHGAGKNSSNEIRSMYSLAFSKRWYAKPAKVSKDFYFSLDRDKRHLVRTI